MTLRAQTMMRVCTSLILAAIVALWNGSQLMAFDLQGHRGARGLLPENTLIGFARALELGVTTLETDLAVTKDGIIVLSHDPLLNGDITRGPDGAWIEAPGPAIHGLTLAELARYDVGRIRPDSKYAKAFPAQVPSDGQRIPTLVQLFELARTFGKSPRFNIETKLSPDKPDETPAPETFTPLVVEAIRSAGLEARVTIQSFDWRTLLIAKRLAPRIETVCLTYERTLEDRTEGGARKPSPWLAGLDPADFGRSVPRLAAATGCGTWSPYFKELNLAAVAEAQAVGLKVVPWTVNAREDIAAVIDMKVDGLISDYPDRAREVMAAKGIALP
jgi:glycerophosphoryl diester phosphodiesterase